MGEADREAPVQAIFSLRSSLTDMCEALHDDEAEVLKITFTRLPPDLADWAIALRDLVLQLEAWWSERGRTRESSAELEKQRARIADRIW